MAAAERPTLRHQVYYDRLLLEDEEQVSPSLELAELPIVLHMVDRADHQWEDREGTDDIEEDKGKAELLALAASMSLGLEH